MIVKLAISTKEEQRAVIILRRLETQRSKFRIMSGKSAYECIEKFQSGRKSTIQEEGA